jgi:hypothetical protein
MADSGCSKSVTPDASEFAFLVVDPTFTPVFAMNGLDTPLAFKASSDPDTLTFDEAMADPDRPRWIESAHKEIKSLEGNHPWEEVDVAEAKTKIMPGTWVFRCKRTPDGVISKFKGYCMRTMLPLRRILIEVVTALELPSRLQASIHARVFEDNNGALLLANDQRIMLRTKYFLVKWHFFWSHITNGNCNHSVTVNKVDTKLQDADYMTKGLPREPYEKNRFRVQGW